MHSSVASKFVINAWYCKHNMSSELHFEYQASVCCCKLTRHFCMIISRHEIEEEASPHSALKGRITTVLTAVSHIIQQDNDILYTQLAAPHERLTIYICINNSEHLTLQ